MNLTYIQKRSLTYDTNIQSKIKRANLQEDGRGGDILFDMEYEYTLSFDGHKFNLQGLFSQSQYNEFDNWKNFDRIGIEE